MGLLSGRKVQALDKQTNNEPSLVPKLPFSLVLSGGKGAGKSSTLLNLLLSKDLLAGKFNRIYYISPTASLDSKLNVLKETPGILAVNKLLIKEFAKQKKLVKLLDDGSEGSANYETSLTEDSFIEDCSTQFLVDLMKEQSSVIRKYGKATADKVLLVFDDCISDKRFFNSKQTLKMLFNSRHHNISIIITTQNYNSVPKPIRLNTSILVLFETANKKEIESIYIENNDKLSFKEFYKMYREIVDVQYQFLTISYQNDSQHRYIRNFEEFTSLAIP
jgi:Poxvirus A32 protein